MPQCQFLFSAVFGFRKVVLEIFSELDPTKTEVPIFPGSIQKSEGESQTGSRGATPCLGAGPPLAAPRQGVAVPGPHQAAPFGVLLPPETLRPTEPSRECSAASAGRKTTEREKLSGREKSAGEIPSRREEIVAIVTVIELDFIGIIIVIISITITIHLHSSTPFRCNI